MKALDLKGKIFNYLTCIEPTTERKGSSVVWKCLCECGNICYKPADTIKDGRSKSCGCHKYKSEYGAGFWAVYLSYLHRSKKKSIEFSLTEEEFHFLIKGDCYYCGSEPFQTKRKYKYNGIDRINNLQGYAFDNCVSCCKFCNQAKSNRTLEEFEEWIRKVCYRL